jgi:hypothetical protein
MLLLLLQSLVLLLEERGCRGPCADFSKRFMLLLQSLVLLLKERDAEELVQFLQSASCCCCRTWCCCWRSRTLRNLCCFSKALHVFVVAEPGAVFAEHFMLLLLQSLVLFLQSTSCCCCRAWCCFYRALHVVVVAEPGAVFAEHFILLLQSLVLFLQSTSCSCCCRAWCCCWRSGTLRNLCCFSRALHAVVVAEPGAVVRGAGRQAAGAVFAKRFMLLLLQTLVLLLKEWDAEELVLLWPSACFM